MKYCVDYYKHIDGLDKADEYTIRYSKKNDVLITFLQENQNKIVNLTIEEALDAGDYKTLKAIYQTFPNFRLRFERYNPETIEDIVECGIPFFFGNRVNNWDEFLGLLDLGVTDIYVIEDMCFDLERVAIAAKLEGVQLRTYANIAQSTWKDTSGVFKFWIRPEDIDLYSNYIDTIEFFGTPQQQGILVKVYSEIKQWFGPLNEIIIGLNESIDSRYIVKEFGERRLHCQKNCRKGGKCRVCHRVLELSKLLEQNDLIVKKDK